MWHSGDEFPLLHNNNCESNLNVQQNNSSSLLRVVFLSCKEQKFLCRHIFVYQHTLLPSMEGLLGVVEAGLGWEGSVGLAWGWGWENTLWFKEYGFWAICDLCFNFGLWYTITYFSSMSVLRDLETLSKIQINTSVQFIWLCMSDLIA